MSWRDTGGKGREAKRRKCSQRSKHQRYRLLLFIFSETLLFVASVGRTNPLSISEFGSLRDD